MSEFLADILDKFIKATDIFKEAVEIKDSLRNSKANSELAGVLEKTKNIIETLYDNSRDLNDQFFVEYDNIYAKVTNSPEANQEKEVVEVPSAAQEQNSGEELSKSPENNAESIDNDPLADSGPVNDKRADSEVAELPKEPFKPSIKLVDINKLVEPKTMIKNDSTPKEKKTVQFDTSVILISTSSDDSSDEYVSRRRRRIGSIKNKNGKKFSESKSSSPTVKDRKRPKGPLQTKTKPDLFDLSDSSVNLSDNESLPQLKDDKNTSASKSQDASYEWEKDIKFKTRCIVNVLQIPCEEMKEYYKKKMEEKEIESLTNVNTLKRKRIRKTASDDSVSLSEEEKDTTKKTKPNTKTSGKVASDSEDKTSDDSPVENGPDPTPDKDNFSNTPPSEESVDAIKLVLDMLCSDNESKLKSDSDREESETEKEKTLKEQTAPEKAKKADDTGTAETDKSETNNKITETAGENSEKEVTDNGEKPKSDDAKDSTDEEESTKINKAKTNWKKDKLLTASISSTDSEEELRRFKKKKNAMKDDDSDDDEKVVVDKKKRGNKRLKKVIVLDSDSQDDEKSKSSGDDSDNSQRKSSSNSESEKENEKKGNSATRKRIRRVKDSSSDDNDESSTRKQIRKVWGNDSLAESTRQAEAEEKERKARLADKQKKYNQIYDSNVEMNAKVDKVVLDFDEKANSELLKVDEKIVEKLKPHQAAGVQFMWDACFESLDRAKSTKGSGCILAHCMGLGKTLQVIALTHTLLINSEETMVKKVMVVCPLSTVLNWVNEYKKWLPDEDDFEVFELVSFKQNYERQHQMKEWHNCGGVLIIGYDMFRNLSNPDSKRISKKMRTVFQEALVDPGPDLVICDEGHLLKNEKTNLSIAMNRLKTMRRIVLTGTPLQNNLKEYFCMVQFIKPNLLGTYKEYLNRFVNPITNGQYTDSTHHDIQIMRKRSHVLHKLLDGVVQRRDYSVLQPYLPPKHEYVLFLALSETQIKLYDYYLKNFARRNTDGSNRTSFLFVDFQNLQRICTHPRVLLDKSLEEKNAKLNQDETDSEGSLRDFIDDEDDSTSGSGSSSSSDSDNSDGSEKKKNKTKNQKTKSGPRKRLTRAAMASAKENNEEVEFVELTSNFSSKEWWQEFCDGDELDNIAHSSKLSLLFEVLKECEQIGDKVLVFSQSLYSLNVIEYFLGKVHDATQENKTLCGYTGSWCLGLDYFRLDGSSSCDNRSNWCNSFNDPKNTRARLFIISTRAGGLGINLVAANRVIIFDVSWNPSHDIQSIYRIYRFGQTKPCYVYRFVTYGTMEMKVYERQVIKQAISKRVIDEQQIDRHYNQNDLAELYKFEAEPEDRPIPLVPKDVLLGELLQKFEDRIYKYHEHQSLLENKEEECLNEEERKAAWEEFENEKIQRSRNTTNFMAPPAITTALMSLVQKDNPSWTDQQVKMVIPALTLQLQEQVAAGDLTMYQRVTKEIRLLQQIHNQKLRQQYLQQQAFRMFQQQHTMAHNGLRYPNPSSWQNIPGTSHTTPKPSFTTEVIDLND